MPHPPIIVPEVGKGAEAGAALTIKGVSDIMSRVSDAVPDRLLLISPHQPYIEGTLAVNISASAMGSFAAFGVPNVSFSLTNSLNDAMALSKFLESAGIPVAFTDSRSLDRDQGSMVPLYFLKKQFGELPPTVLMNACGLGMELAFKLGEALSSFDDGHRWGFIASGDLSHRLTPNAPAGHSPFGTIFDKAVQAALSACSIDILKALPPRTIYEAGECGLCSASAMIGFCSASGSAIDVLSYEGPFGVGYCCAISMKAGEKVG